MLQQQVWFPKELEAQGPYGTVQISGVGAWVVLYMW